MKGQAHSDETRAEVIAALLAGQGVNEISRQYKIPKATVSRLKNSLAAKQLEQVGTQKREQIADLIEGHLRQSLKAAAALAEKVATNNEWFIKQNAADVGVLYGILTDKSIRILEAAEVGDEASSKT
ncbi:MAG TPA: hypothetical protein VF290_18085 [Pyrinomonadaceae bacterium]